LGRQQVEVLEDHADAPPQRLQLALAEPADLAPNNKALLRSFVGRATEQAFMQMTDEEILEVVLRDLRKIMTIRQEPEFYSVTRLQNAIPYVVGHQAWVRDVKQKLKASLPGVMVAGASYDGVGVPDCIAQGKKAILEWIASVQPGS
ncbi:hypothetical protein EN829_052310, partial [Mesorhizobium sp. M00.F.Ca.ET.186.01.1.1]